MNVYLVNVTIHVFAALFWLGGMFFLAAVGAPVLRKVEPAELRAALFRQLGEQFRVVGWVAIAILLITGVINLHLRGLLPALLDPAFWGTRYGVTLAWKVGAVAGMLVVQAIHDFIVGPASVRATPGSPAALRLRRKAALLARLSAVFGIVIVIAAVRLARGG
jgi:putative copper resistance protein D